MNFWPLWRKMILRPYYQFINSIIFTICVSASALQSYPGLSTNATVVGHIYAGVDPEREGKHGAKCPFIKSGTQTSMSRGQVEGRLTKSKLGKCGAGVY